MWLVILSLETCDRVSKERPKEDTRFMVTAAAVVVEEDESTSNTAPLFFGYLSEMLRGDKHKGAITGTI
jgi:hypothetical protein